MQTVVLGPEFACCLDNRHLFSPNSANLKREALHRANNIQYICMCTINIELATGYIPRKFAVISKPKNVCLSAEKTK